MFPPRNFFSFEPSDVTRWMHEEEGEMACTAGVLQIKALLWKANGPNELNIDSIAHCSRRASVVN
jgi:hypothetical protein